MVQQSIFWQLRLNLQVFVLCCVFYELNWLFDSLCDRLRSICWCKFATLDYFVIKKIICVEECQIRACQNKLYHLLLILWLYLIHEAFCNHNVGTQGCQHLMMNRCVESLEKSTFFLLLFELMKTSDISESEHLTLLIIKCDINSFNQKNLAVLVYALSILHLVHFYSFYMFPTEDIL